MDSKRALTRCSLKTLCWLSTKTKASSSLWQHFYCLWKWKKWGASFNISSFIDIPDLSIWILLEKVKNSGELKSSSSREFIILYFDIFLAKVGAENKTPFSFLHIPWQPQLARERVDWNEQNKTNSWKMILGFLPFHKKNAHCLKSNSTLYFILISELINMKCQNYGLRAKTVN